MCFSRRSLTAEVLLRTYGSPLIAIASHESGGETNLAVNICWMILRTSSVARQMVEVPKQQSAQTTKSSYRQLCR